mmetsp:Transcript_2141/g.3869  ORF Transcript_2141/g.3869 Transcript_2141/m.3869 type:complete len:506 (-) Transcript_2141:553-2070(-)
MTWPATPADQPNEDGNRNGHAINATTFSSSSFQNNRSEMKEGDKNHYRPHQERVLLSIDEAMEKVGCGPFQNTLLVIVGLCFCADSIEITLLSFLTGVLRAEWNLSATEAASITSSVFLGQVIGTLVLGPLGDRMGRRPVFFLSAFIISFFGILTATAWNVPSLLLARTLCGFGVGGINVPFDILAEFTTSEQRGTYLLGVEFFWTFGVLMVAIFAYWTLDGANDWRTFVLLCAIPCVLSLVAAIFYVPESPRWLLSQGRTEEAMQVLKSAAARNGHDPILLFSDVELMDGSGPQHDEEDSSDFLELLKPKWRRITLLLWATWFGMEFSYYGTILIVTRVFMNDGRGDMNDYDDDDGGNHAAVEFEYGSIFISSSAELLGLTFVIYTVDRIGRILPATCFFFLGGVFCLMLTVAAETSQPIAVLTLIAFCAKGVEMGSSCLLWVSTAELLPTEIRSTGNTYFVSSRSIAYFLFQIMNITELWMHLVIMHSEIILLFHFLFMYHYY